MAYDQQRAVQLVDSGTAASTGVKGSYFGGLEPFVVRQFSVVCKTDPAGAVVIVLKHRPTPGSASGEVAIATINIAAGHNAGDVVYKTGLNYAVKGSEEIVVDVTTAAASLTSFNASAQIDPNYEVVGNLDAAVVATA